MNHPFTSTRAGLTPLLASDFFLSTLATKNGMRSINQLAGDIKAYLGRDKTLAAFKALVREGYATEESGRATLTKSGMDRAKTLFGHLPSGKDGRKRLERVVWPALALGIDPASKAASRLALGENLRAVALTGILGLPLDKGTVTLNAAVATLLIRGLSGAGSLAQPNEVLKAEARSLGDLSDPDSLRKGLVMAGLALADQTSPSEARSAEDDIDGFAQRVQVVTNALSTPPFSRKVAISQVYDAYGKKYADAGRLDTFKDRLLEAHASRALSLYPLDEPEALDPAVRTRSLIETRHGRYHFVARSG
jgi:hypothetical protein